MAKKSSIENNKHRMKLVKQFSGRRERLKAIANDMSLSVRSVSKRVSSLQNSPAIRRRFASATAAK